MSCDVGCRCGLNPVLLWLWRRPAATALIQSLAWELLPYAMGAALKRPKKLKNKEEEERKKEEGKKKEKLTTTFLHMH